jgi:hypothetical protein
MRQGVIRAPGSIAGLSHETILLSFFKKIHHHRRFNGAFCRGEESIS